mmetsp:Transcript_57014/g.163738  ORF Transcript_57014/g.163738 Transcript_57014/m.163738 type:complete len:200 (-) Transcript_57014:305-904(-)
MPGRHGRSWASNVLLGGKRHVAGAALGRQLPGRQPGHDVDRPAHECARVAARGKPALPRLAAACRADHGQEQASHARRGAFDVAVGGAPAAVSGGEAGQGPGAGRPRRGRGRQVPERHGGGTAAAAELAAGGEGEPAAALEQNRDGGNRALGPPRDAGELQAAPHQRLRRLRAAPAGVAGTIERPREGAHGLAGEGRRG